MLNRRKLLGALAASPLALLPDNGEAAPHEDGFYEDGEFFSYRFESTDGKTYRYPSYLEVAERYETELKRRWALERGRDRIWIEYHESQKPWIRNLMDRNYSTGVENESLKREIARLRAAPNA